MMPRHFLKGLVLLVLAICIVFTMVDFWLAFDATVHQFTPVVAGVILIIVHGTLGLWTWVLFKALETY